VTYCLFLEVMRQRQKLSGNSSPFLVAVEKGAMEPTKVALEEASRK